MDTPFQEDVPCKVNTVDAIMALRGKATLFLCGGLAGCLAKSAVAPLDRVKIILQTQTHNEAHESHGISKTLKHVWSTEGFTGLYRSNGAQMIRIFPYSGIQFLSFDVYLNKLSEFYGDNKWTRLSSGSMAGMTAVALTHPLDVARTRLALQSAGGGHAYAGIVDCLRHARSQGALYSGLGPSLLGVAPYAGVSFCAYNWLQLAALNRWPGVFGCAVDEAVASGSPSNHRRRRHRRLRAWAQPLIGGLAGAAAQTVSCPMDCVRRAMQVAVAAGRPRSGAAATLAALYQRHGLAGGLYRGLSLNYVRAVPTAGVSFAAYESLRQALRV